MKYGSNIICGDSGAELLKLPADYIDLTVTSPPYDSLRSYNGYSFDFESIARELYRITKPGGGSSMGGRGYDKKR